MLFFPSQRCLTWSKTKPHRDTRPSGIGLRTLHFFRSPPVVYRSNIRLLVVLGVIPDALKTAGCAQSRAVNDFVHTSTFLVNFGSVSSLFEVFQTCENLY